MLLRMRSTHVSYLNKDHIIGNCIVVSFIACQVAVAVADSSSNFLGQYQGSMAPTQASSWT